MLPPIDDADGRIYQNAHYTGTRLTAVKYGAVVVRGGVEVSCGHYAHPTVAKARACRAKLITRLDRDTTS